MNVLIVDDSETARMFIRKCLEIAGLREAEFCHASDGAAAWEILTTRPVDLLVSDVNMPRMNGEELLRKMSAAGVATKTLMITSAAGGDASEKLIGLGAMAVLPKPVSPAVLAPVVAPLLAKRSDG